MMILQFGLSMIPSAITSAQNSIITGIQNVRSSSLCGILNDQLCATVRGGTGQGGTVDEFLMNTRQFGFSEQTTGFLTEFQKRCHANIARESRNLTALETANNLPPWMPAEMRDIQRRISIYEKMIRIINAYSRP